MLKIIYFDENSAIDYLEIKNRGRKTKNTDKKNQTTGSVETGMGARIGTSPVLNMISGLFGADISVEAKASVSKAGESIIKTTISTSILSEYFETTNKDAKVSKIKDHRIVFDEGSLTYIKTIFPIFNIMGEDLTKDMPINFSKIDSAIDYLKGYYSTFAEDENGNKKILRFNIKAFRNNYKLTDLTIMNLTFYAVKVGEMELVDNKLSFDNEFMQKNTRKPSKAKVAGREPEEAKKYDLFDVVLAGVMESKK